MHSDIYWPPTLKLVSFLEKWRTSTRLSGQQKNPDICWEAKFMKAKKF